MVTGSGRTGVMVVRIWIEGADGTLRARLTETLDVTTREDTSRVASTLEEIVEIVSAWVDEFVTAVAE
jgi:hypothetical protein